MSEPTNRFILVNLPDPSRIKTPIQLVGLLAMVLFGLVLVAPDEVATGAGKMLIGAFATASCVALGAYVWRILKPAELDESQPSGRSVRGAKVTTVARAVPSKASGTLRIEDGRSRAHQLL